MVQAQLAERSRFHYPPYYRMVYVYLKHRNASLLDQLAATMATRLRLLFGARVNGPFQPPVAKVQRFFIRQIVLKFESGLSPSGVRQALLQVQQDLLGTDHFKSLQVYYDVDPA